MLVRNERFKEKKEWAVGDIIIFGEEGTKANYGMIIVIENQFDLVILKSDDFPRGTLGFHYYASIGEIQDKLELLYPFVKNAGQIGIEKVLSNYNTDKKITYNRSDGLNSKDAENMVNRMADQYLKLEKEAKEHIKDTIKSEQFSKKLNSILDKALTRAITKNAQINQGKREEPVIVLDSYISFDYFDCYELLKFLDNSSYSLISNEFNNFEKYTWKLVNREISNYMLGRGYVKYYMLIPDIDNPIYGRRGYVWVPLDLNLNGRGFWFTKTKIRRLIKTRVEKLISI